MTTYELWVHEILGIYAVRRSEAGVTGVCGPLPLRTAADGHLARLSYDGSEAALARPRESPEQYRQFQPWLKGEAVPVAGPPSEERRPSLLVGLFIAQLAFLLLLVASLLDTWIGAALTASQS